MALKKTKTTGRKSESFARELDKSAFVLGPEREKDLTFIMGQPNRGQRVLDYFLRTGLKYKEVFDAINIGDLPLSKQVAHQKEIARLLQEYGWEGKVDLHVRPVGAYDHPSPHFHLWGSQITKEVYSLVKDYLLENKLTDSTRLKIMKSAKVIHKISREDLSRARTEAKHDRSVEPIAVKRIKSSAGKRLADFVEKNKVSETTKVAVESYDTNVATLKEKIMEMKKTFAEDKLVVKSPKAAARGVDTRFENIANDLKDRMTKLKSDLTTRS